MKRAFILGVFCAGFLAAPAGVAEDSCDVFNRESDAVIAEIDTADFADRKKHASEVKALQASFRSDDLKAIVCNLNAAQQRTARRIIAADTMAKRVTLMSLRIDLCEVENADTDPKRAAGYRTLGDEMIGKLQAFIAGEKEALGAQRDVYDTMQSTLEINTEDYEVCG